MPTTPTNQTNRVPRFPLALRLARKAGVLGRLNVTLSATAAGRRWKVPVRGGEGWRNSAPDRFDPWRLPLMRAALARPGAFVDVGANVGQTLLQVRGVDPDRAYVGWEPNPACVDYLHRLVAANDLAGVTVVPAGLSDRAGLLTLHEHADHSAIASLVDGFRPAAFYTRARHVAVLRGDDVLRDLGVGGGGGPVAAVKIDVEGGELDVVRGLPETLAAHAPPVFCEILPVLEPGHDTDELRALRTARQEALLGLLHGHGYRAFRTPHGGGLEELPAGETGAAVIAPHADLALTDYLFLPPDRVEEFRAAADAPASAA